MICWDNIFLFAVSILGWRFVSAANSTVDDSAFSLITYGPEVQGSEVPWKHNPSTLNISCWRATDSWTFTRDAWAEYSFSGLRAIYYMGYGLNSSAVIQVSVDDEVYEVDLNVGESGKHFQAILFGKTGLDPNVRHKIRLQNINGVEMHLDGFTGDFVALDPGFTPTVIGGSTMFPTATSIPDTTGLHLNETTVISTTNMNNNASTQFISSQGSYSSTATGNLPVQTSGQEPQPISGGLVAGAVIGGFSAVLTVCLIAFWLWRRRTKEKESHDELGSSTEAITPTTARSKRSRLDAIDPPPYSP